MVLNASSWSYLGLSGSSWAITSMAHTLDVRGARDETKNLNLTIHSCFSLFSTEKTSNVSYLRGCPGWSQTLRLGTILDFLAALGPSGPFEDGFGTFLKHFRLLLEQLWNNLGHLGQTWPILGAFFGPN
jgi:hypothetical protein